MHELDHETKVKLQPVFTVVCLKTVTKILPAVRLDERTGNFCFLYRLLDKFFNSCLGKKTWFNSIIAAFLGWQDERNDRKKAVTFGDGELIDEADILKCAEILEESSVVFPWAQGDVLLIDNRLVLHARKSFEPPRRILAALFQ
jgi:hypothetical protein